MKMNMWYSPYVHWILAKFMCSKIYLNSIKCLKQKNKGNVTFIVVKRIEHCIYDYALYDTLIIIILKVKYMVNVLIQGRGTE